MNFLAHTFFAKQDQQLIVGQFCGDFLRGHCLSDFPQNIQKGIRMHRLIDGYTDQHPVNLEARALFDPPYRRFAGILTDVVYDHYLARSWSEYSQRSLSRHIELVHKALENNFELLPLRLQRFARLIIDESVLISYLHFDAVDLALTRISWRSERFKLLARAGDTVRLLDHELSASFSRFFPDLVQHVEHLNQQDREQ